MTRGLRNNNPLNMRHDKDTWKGEVKPGTDSAFKQFRTMAWGYRAAFKLLHNYQRLHGCRTLADFIRRWAPPSENDTDAYIRIVAQRSGLSDTSPVDTLDSQTMQRIVAAMSQVENGVPADASEVAEGWTLFCEG